MRRQWRQKKSGRWAVLGMTKNGGVSGLSRHRSRERKSDKGSKWLEGKSLKGPSRDEGKGEGIKVEGGGGGRPRVGEKGACSDRRGKGDSLRVDKSRKKHRGIR